MAVLVDSNVLLDVLTNDRRWFAWSSGALAREAEGDVVAIEPIIYAEVSIGFERIEDLDAALPSTVNLAEAAGKLIERGADAHEVAVLELGVERVPSIRRWRLRQRS